MHEPNNADFHNNLGFCLLPDNPDLALVSLNKADELGYTDKLVNLANRALALILLGRHAVALRLVEDAYEVALDSPDVRGMMWALDSLTTDPVLMTLDDPTVYVAGLGVMVAKGAEDAELLDLWTGRLG